MSDYADMARFEAARAELQYWQERTEAARTTDEMTIRDQFAAHAMQGFLASGEAFSNNEGLARESYDVADAMLAARESK